MDALRLLLPVLDLLDRWPWVRRAAGAMPGTGWLPDAPRAFLGHRAFDLHEIDAEHGEIRLWGVNEVMFTARWLGHLHDEIGAALDPDAKDRLLYRVAERGAREEVRQGLQAAGWMPDRVARAMRSGNLLDECRRDPDLGRFFEHLVREVSRLIITEGGWGRVVEYAFREDPIRVVIAESVEAKVCGPSDRPTCAITAGGIAGQLGGLTGGSFVAREARCRSMGARDCAFEVAPQ